MAILIAGSIAYDHIMFFDGYFKEVLIPQALDHLSISFLASSRNTYFGGCSCNIAYNLKLLNENPLIFGVAGNDFDLYKEWLKKNKISDKYIDIDKKLPTSACYILNDKNSEQITFFSPAAMQNSSLAMGFKSLPVKNIQLAIISPDTEKRMLSVAHECIKHSIPYFFDPGQASPILNNKNLLFIFKNSIGVFVNEYEGDLLCKKLNLSRAEISQKTKFLVETLGKNGAKIYTNGKNFIVNAIQNLNSVDITGAGDAFRAGFIHGFLNKKSLEDCVKIANTTASFAIEKIGTQTYKFTYKDFFSRLKKFYKIEI